MQEEACSVCWRNFTTVIVPLVLHCGHSFCQECSAMVRSCPLCRQRVPNNQSRRTNYSLLSLIEKLERNQPREMTNQQTQTEEGLAASSTNRSAIAASPFFAGKNITVAVKKSGVHLAIK